MSSRQADQQSALKPEAISDYLKDALSKDGGLQAQPDLRKPVSG
jgi:hypothetical protein